MAVAAPRRLCYRQASPHAKREAFIRVRRSGLCRVAAAHRPAV